MVGFEKFRNLTIDILEQFDDLNTLINECFEKYGLDLTQTVRTTTARFVYHTMCAKLPEIHGNRETGSSFQLCELLPDEHHAEVEFWLSREKGVETETQVITGNHRGEHFSKGFIDLLFVRKDENGNPWYSVLDWKTNLYDDSVYYDPGQLKQKVDMEYAVQRTLYSYCLIEWLGTFPKYQHLTSRQIFEQHFGGVYYAFVRGCRCQTANGIYAQTWPDYEMLKQSYLQIINQLMFAAKLDNS